MTNLKTGLTHLPDDKQTVDIDSLNKKVAFKTLGCRLNQYETESLATRFQSSGYSVVNFKEDADVFVINSCTVTKQSDHKSRTFVHNAARRAHKPIVVLTGCMANNHEAELQKSDQITYLVKNESKSTILNLVDAHFRGEVFPKEFLKQDVFSYQAVDQIFHTRSMVKIQDGCDNHCSFCIIPKVRGSAVSRPKEAVLQNIRDNIANGFKEMVITGVNIGRYDDRGTNFETLLKLILEIPGDFRVRISSLEPDGLSDAFIELMRHPKLCQHLHLCMQSGSEKVLMQMRRFYSLDSYLELIEKIKAINPDFCFTTDIIVGFPNEDETDFEASCKVAKHVGFSHIHTFKYSKREGTSATRIKEQVPEKTKAIRSKIMRELAANSRKLYFEQMLGKTGVVLVEKQKEEKASGLSDTYIPVRFSIKENALNTFHTVRYTKVILDKDEWMMEAEHLHKVK